MEHLGYLHTSRFRIGFPRTDDSSASRRRHLRLRTVRIDPTPTNLGVKVETVATRFLVAQLFALRQIIQACTLPSDHGVSAVNALATSRAQASVTFRTCLIEYFQGCSMPCSMLSEQIAMQELLLHCRNNALEQPPLYNSVAVLLLVLLSML